MYCMNTTMLLSHLIIHSLFFESYFFIAKPLLLKIHTSNVLHIESVYSPLGTEVLTSGIVPRPVSYTHLDVYKRQGQV